jgi:ABC-type transport system substrate-binding protein
MTLSSDTPCGIAQSMGLGVIGFAQAFARRRPDILLVLGDRFEMALLFYGGVSEDPDSMRTRYSSRARTEGRFLIGGAQGYANPEFDDLAERQLVTLDEAERRRLVARMQQIVAADLPFLNLFYRRAITVLRSSVFDDQWARPGVEGGPTNKQALVTGTATGGNKIRPIR